jgi:transcriptional regulator with XRE-family HTH domain
MDTVAERILQRLHTFLPGVSQAELARRVDMDPSALSRVINGKRGLAGSEVAAIAAQLQVSTDWLLLGEEPFPIAIAARHDYAGGAYSSVLDDDSMSLVSGIALAYEQAGELPEQETAIEVPTDPAEVRRMLESSFGADWPRHFAEAVERTFAIDVVKAELPGHAGLSLKLPNATVIVVPTQVFWGRQNWTIAHELWHVANGHFSALHEGAAADGEASANNFAKELLLPEKLIFEVDWAAISEAELADFLWRSGASLQALSNRLAALRLPALRYDGAPLGLFRRHVKADHLDQDPVTSRLRDAAARRFPTRLLVQHEVSGQHPRTLAWMLGAPLEAGDDPGELPEPANADDLAALFGLSAT